MLTVDDRHGLGVDDFSSRGIGKYDLVRARADFSSIHWRDAPAYAVDRDIGERVCTNGYFAKCLGGFAARA